ncbi:MAG: hypothetical protein FWB74_07305 [Defluviitaleaceae bacterium]|nr:hypothetical protein [Defluviitaleaceae bacterium]
MAALKDIESKYRSEIEAAGPLTAQTLVELSVRLYEEIKVPEIDDNVYFGDVLLFQYGIYDWRDENGRHFELDITRQFQCPLPDDDEPYQLSFTLIFDPEPFENAGFDSCRSGDFDDWNGDMDDLANHFARIAAAASDPKPVDDTWSLFVLECGF